MLELVYENQTGDTSRSEDFFRRVVDSALTNLNLDNKTIELGLHLVTPERSQELNKQHRQKDKPTDVLSFPLNEQGLEKYGILPLGDIFICLEIAKRQADEINIPIDQELARLVVHGLLHLLGYDHELSPVDEKKMIDLQESIVKETIKRL
jgi:probable rRNA maturation factor